MGGTIEITDTNDIDRSVPLSELAAAVQAITSKPVKVAYDAVSSPETQTAAYSVVAPCGKLGIVLSQAIDADKLTGDKEIGHIMGNTQVPKHREFGAILYTKLADLVESGEIKVCFTRYVL